MIDGPKDIVDAMWAQDRDTLERLAPCRCCCHEHTFADCPARVWNGCRSGLAPGEEEIDLHPASSDAQ